MRLICICITFLISSLSFAQSEQLARNYMAQGEFEKALSIYKKLHQKIPSRTTFMLGLVESYQQLERFGDGEQVLLNHIQRYPTNPRFYVELGHHYDLTGDSQKSRTNYDKAIAIYKASNSDQAFSLAQAFEKYNLLDEAATIYEEAMQNSPRNNYNIHLAKIYGEQGKLDKMFNSYLELIQAKPNYANLVRRNCSSYINEDPMNDANIIFRKLLIKKSQENPDTLYNEMLSWLFIQQKEYKKAFIQEKAIYRRRNEGFQRILDVAQIAISGKDMKSAETILEYIIEGSTTDEEMKLLAHQILLKSKTKTAEKKEYKSINEAYQKVFENYGKSRKTLDLQTDYAHFMAFDQDRKKEGFNVLKSLLKNERLSVFDAARVKMEIADILVLDQKFNQALIYYSQVQNKLKNNYIAHDARFKVAKTSYYKGDFKWAQTQLDVLKSSTSQLIANDAMELSLIISDNSLEDSTQTALKIYAKADLLAFQNKNQEAIAMYEKILTHHKGEKIEDETFLSQAKLYEKERQYEKATINYLKIIEFYPDDILADDALYGLAELYVNHLNTPEKAKELYEKIIFNHADSIYFVDSRKKYRTLRGDAIN